MSFIALPNRNFHENSLKSSCGQFIHLHNKYSAYLFRFVIDAVRLRSRFLVTFHARQYHVLSFILRYTYTLCILFSDAWNDTASPLVQRTLLYYYTQNCISFFKSFPKILLCARRVCDRILLVILRITLISGMCVYTRPCIS